ncbi:MAG TPA: hypothetical protein VF771_03280 [Longimicrobiaceae bacterium]
MSDTSPQAQLDGFLAKYTPEIAAEAVEALERLRAQVPGAVEMVYDNYNALVIGFGATEKASEAVLSIALMPRWVTLCFLQGARLPDPHRLLRGGGNIVRNIRLGAAADIDSPGVRELIALAVAQSPTPFDTASRGRMVIKSVSARQRPRRPSDRPAGSRHHG